MPAQSGVRLLPFQREFEAAAMNPAYDVAAMSGPRGLSKTFLAARVLTRCMTPGDPFHEPGAHYILGASSIDQARLCYDFIQPALEPMGGFRFLNSAQRIGITHVETGTQLRVISSSGKTAFGLVNVRLVVLDEPGAFDIIKGQMMADALFTALGKVGSPLKLVMIGTLAPMATTAGHWWYDLVDLGTSGTTHVTSFRGEATKWDQWAEIRRCNPLTAISPEFRAKLLQERDAARKDSRLKARFLSYRLNCPSADESTVLLTVDDWQRTEARAVPDVEGRPVVGLDLGGGRAWSAAVALWPNGRCEAIAVAPGIPSIEVQEKRDRVSRGTYQRLVDSGRLQIADGLRCNRLARSSSWSSRGIRSSLCATASGTRNYWTSPAAWSSCRASRAGPKRRLISGRSGSPRRMGRSRPTLTHAAYSKRRCLPRASRMTNKAASG